MEHDCLDGQAGIGVDACEETAHRGCALVGCGRGLVVHGLVGGWMEGDDGQETEHDAQETAGEGNGIDGGGDGS